MGKILVASLPDPSGNPRPNRTIRLLFKTCYEVHTLSPKLKREMNEVSYTYEINSNSVSVIFKIIRRSILLINSVAGIFGVGLAFFEKTYSYVWQLSKHKKALIRERYDLIISEDLTLLPFLISIARKSGSKVILDAREYYSRELEGSGYFRFFIAPEKKHLCKILLSKLDAFYTVSKGLSDLYEREYGIKPEVIRSTPDYQNPDFRPISSFPIKLVHHGIANRDRCLENMIKVVSRLGDKYTLDFYLTGDEKYINELKALSSGDNSRIYFRNPVRFDQINSMLRNYDIGFYFLVPTGFNTTYNLPNKFFEFIQAGLGVIIGPSPEMQNLVKEYGVGLISKSFSIDSMVDTLMNASLDDLNFIKQNSINAAGELSWEFESKKLTKLIASVIS